MTQNLSEVRTRNYKGQLKGSLVFKFLAVGASFIAMPIMIHYLGQEKFGIWSTLLSIVTWVVFFDLGIGNGLRNKLAESLARNDIDEAVNYISSGYTLIAFVSFTLFAFTVIVSFIIPWQSVFNTDAVTEEGLRNVVLLTSFIVTFNFWVGLINQLLNAVQKVSVVVFGQFISNALALIAVYILSLVTDASLLYLATAYGFSLIVANVSLSFWFYQKRSDLIPRVSLSGQHIKPLLSLGSQFFIIQLAVLIIFTTDKILITQLFGPLYVTQYDAVYKVFSFITLVYGLITAPLWSAYTDAHSRGDFEWIKQILCSQIKVFSLIVVLAIFFILFAKSIIAIWIGDEIRVPGLLVVSMGGVVLISVWSNIFGCIVNGIGEIRIQLYSSIVAMLLNIPLSIYLTKYAGMGVYGVVIATCISLSFFALIGPVQVYFILRKKVS